MKKILTMMLIMASFFNFYSCSEDKDEAPTVPSDITLKVGETYELKLKAEWKSENPFVATVNNNGTITAQKVGATEIYATNNDLSSSVKVLANYTLYRDPYTNWGASINSITKALGTPDKNETEDGVTTLTYTSSDSNVPLEMYMFDNNKLTSSAVLVNIIFEEELIKHLQERYNLIEAEEGAYFFINAQTMSDATTLVMAMEFMSDYWMVIYIDASSADGTMSNKKAIKSLIPELKLDL